jgi:glycine cleavage system H protein
MMANLKYSASHEWVSVEGDVATIGITDFAQSSLGSIVFVDLPQVGKSFDNNAVFGVVESVKAASDLYIPLGGTVVEVNSQLTGSPELLNSDAEKTFIIKIKMANPSELDALMSKADYDAMPK